MDNHNRAARRKQLKRRYGSGRWERVRLMVLERDNYTCQIKLDKCRVRANTVDHVQRPEEGGAEYDPSNLRAACRSCNLRRHDAAYFRERADAVARPTEVDGVPTDAKGIPTTRVHWHPAGADQKQQMLIGHYQRTALCPCELPQRTP